jgi:hypothetical protein
MGRDVTLACADARSAGCHPAACDCVVARLRALEAVARAARRSIQPYRDAHGRNIGGGHAVDCRCRLCRALARLERAGRARR